jgi:genome maintenance exonuclease 1
MKFSNRLPAAALTKRISKVNHSPPPIQSNDQNHLLRVVTGSDDQRLFNSLSRKIREAWSTITHSFTYEKDLICSRESSSLSSATTKPVVDGVLDFPELLEALPADVRQRPVLKFPFLNPWRMGRPFTELDISEEEAQKNRALVLDVSFPVRNFPSVTRVLQSTMSEASISSLDKWKQKMVTELGEVGFVQHQRKLFHRGSLLHRTIAHKLSHPDDSRDVPDEIAMLWKSLSPVFPAISDVRVLEKNVAHPFLCYKGIADCIACYKNELVVIDWKTSARSKSTLSDLYDEPLQAAAYAGAVNYDKDLGFQVEKFVVVIAYESGDPADVHAFNHTVCKDYWNLWLARLRGYWETLEQSQQTQQS